MLWIMQAKDVVIIFLIPIISKTAKPPMSGGSGSFRY